MGRRQQWVYRVEPSQFPPDFPERLERFMKAGGFTSLGLARRLRVNNRMLRRWRRGTKPDPGHLVNLFNLAIEVGLLHLLLPAAGERQGVGRQGCAGSSVGACLLDEAGPRERRRGRCVALPPRSREGST